MSGAERHPQAVENLAHQLGVMDESANVFDYTDEATTVISISVEVLAERLVAAGWRHDPLSSDEKVHAECQRRLAAAWSAWLDLALDDRLEDGTPVLSIVFAHNPVLVRRLSGLLSEVQVRRG